MTPKISVIFTTYNEPEWLEKVIWGFSVQSFKNFEVVIADDGSSGETKAVIERLTKEVDFPIQHVWHEDDGFRKCDILNKAIVKAKADYLVFTDGDCIPRKDFLETHYNHRQKNKILSGGLIRLPLDLSKAITKNDIINQRIFNDKWLAENGLKLGYTKRLRLSGNAFTKSTMNNITPTNASWNGHNSSTWKKHVLEANGFDERMKYGGQDREFGERLMNAGIKGKQIRFNAICMHLDHARGYVTKEDWERNYQIRENTRKNKVTRTLYGIEKMHNS